MGHGGAFRKEDSTSPRSSLVDVVHSIYARIETARILSDIPPMPPKTCTALPVIAVPFSPPSPPSLFFLSQPILLLTVPWFGLPGLALGGRLSSGRTVVDVDVVVLGLTQLSKVIQPFPPASPRLFRSPVTPCPPLLSRSTPSSSFFRLVGLRGSSSAEGRRRRSFCPTSVCPRG